MANTNSAAARGGVIEGNACVNWRVVFDYPAFSNIVDASIFEALQDLLARMNASPEPAGSVVFESANPRVLPCPL